MKDSKQWSIFSHKSRSLLGKIEVKSCKNCRRITNFHSSISEISVAVAITDTISIIEIT